MKIFLKQIKIYFRLHKNYQKLSKKHSIYFYIFTMPLFSFFSFFIMKILVLTKSKKIINLISHEIFLSALRYVSPELRDYTSKNLTKYNNKTLSKIKLDDSNEKLINGKKVNKILQELFDDGYSNLGVIFNKKECDEFRNSLINKTCYNSQSPMQSDGEPLSFNPNNSQFNSQKKAYYSFDPSATLSFMPLNDFLKNRDLNYTINTYLNFNSFIYNCVTWYNPPSLEEHYVHRTHRDYDDFKFIALYIYWNNISENDGPLMYVKKSHKNSKITNSPTKISGKEGSVFLIDTFGLHSGSPVKKMQDMLPK